MLCNKGFLSHNYRKTSVLGSLFNKVEVGLSPSKRFFAACLTENPLKIMKNAFYFILKALFVLKIFKFLSRLFGHLGKTA